MGKLVLPDPDDEVAVLGLKHEWNSLASRPPPDNAENQEGAANKEILSAVRFLSELVITATPSSSMGDAENADSGSTVLGRAGMQHRLAQIERRKVTRKEGDLETSHKAEPKHKSPPKGPSRHSSLLSNLRSPLRERAGSAWIPSSSPLQSPAINIKFAEGSSAGRASSATHIPSGIMRTPTISAISDQPLRTMMMEPQSPFFPSIMLAAGTVRATSSLNSPPRRPARTNIVPPPSPMLRLRTTMSSADGLRLQNALPCRIAHENHPKDARTTTPGHANGGHHNCTAKPDTRSSSLNHPTTSSSRRYGSPAVHHPSIVPTAGNQMIMKPANDDVPLPAEKFRSASTTRSQHHLDYLLRLHCKQQGVNPVITIPRPPEAMDHDESRQLEGRPDKFNALAPSRGGSSAFIALPHWHPPSAKPESPVHSIRAHDAQEPTSTETSSSSVQDKGAYTESAIMSSTTVISSASQKDQQLSKRQLSEAAENARRLQQVLLEESLGVGDITTKDIPRTVSSVVSPRPVRTTAPAGPYGTTVSGEDMSKPEVRVRRGGPLIAGSSEKELQPAGKGSASNSAVRRYIISWGDGNSEVYDSTSGSYNPAVITSGYYHHQQLEGVICSAAGSKGAVLQQRSLLEEGGKMKSAGSQRSSPGQPYQPSPCESTIVMPAETTEGGSLLTTSLSTWQQDKVSRDRLKTGALYIANHEPDVVGEQRVHKTIMDSHRARYDNYQSSDGLDDDSLAALQYQGQDKEELHAEEDAGHTALLDYLLVKACRSRELRTQNRIFKDWLHWSSQQRRAHVAAPSSPCPPARASPLLAGPATATDFASSPPSLLPTWINSSQVMHSNPLYDAAVLSSLNSPALVTNMPAYYHEGGGHKSRQNPDLLGADVLSMRAMDSIGEKQTSVPDSAVVACNDKAGNSSSTEAADDRDHELTAGHMLAPKPPHAAAASMDDDHVGPMKKGMRSAEAAFVDQPGRGASVEGRAAGIMLDREASRRRSEHAAGSLPAAKRGHGLYTDLHQMLRDMESALTMTDDTSTTRNRPHCRHQMLRDMESALTMTDDTSTTRNRPHCRHQMLRDMESALTMTDDTSTTRNRPHCRHQTQKVLPTTVILPTTTVNADVSSHGSKNTSAVQVEVNHALRSQAGLEVITDDAVLTGFNKTPQGRGSAASQRASGLTADIDTGQTPASTVPVRGNNSTAEKVKAMLASRQKNQKYHAVSAGAYFGTTRELLSEPGTMLSPSLTVPYFPPGDYYNLSSRNPPVVPFKSPPLGSALLTGGPEVLSRSPDGDAGGDSSGIIATVFLKPIMSTVRGGIVTALGSQALDHCTNHGGVSSTSIQSSAHHEQEVDTTNGWILADEGSGVHEAGMKGLPSSVQLHSSCHGGHKGSLFAPSGSSRMTDDVAGPILRQHSSMLSESRMLLPIPSGEQHGHSHRYQDAYLSGSVGSDAVWDSASVAAVSEEVVNLMQKEPALHNPGLHSRQLQELISKVAYLESELGVQRSAVQFDKTRQGAKGGTGRAAPDGMTERQKKLRGRPPLDVDQKDQRAVAGNVVSKYGSTRRALVSTGVGASARDRVGAQQSVNKLESENAFIGRRLSASIGRPGGQAHINTRSMMRAPTEDQVELSLRKELRELDSALNRRSNF
ncbi:hypothetical protein CEUSTIGMA_g5954.t1 [Chlamydomonas eustigma]|uniref:Uncharacterized protein n=1 Tax=Chlamydomonas eustigma TaxID=1157962 RepID=A0A250X602_9CHLO|nr:hypothetical protein CEUSTIGMA_g5954.t1 [Chlamydomonas eustigma]|eukprot:GAX78514.1 hypothetical protein CEUSTIGMA_g5954.t1 [Chlamydomonas eustigma]